MDEGLSFFNGMATGTFNITYNQDYTAMDLYVAGAIDANFVSPMIWSYVYPMEYLQVLGGNSDWKVNVTVYNMNTGEKIYSATVPKEQLPFG